MIPTQDEHYKSKKIISWEELAKVIAKHKSEGKKIAMCSGSFDMMHPGHITHFEDAKRQCDILFVSVATDKFNEQKTKTDGRPVFNQYVRAYCVSQLESVDYIIFDEGRDSEVVAMTNPDVYIKGADYHNSDNPEFLKVVNFLNKNNVDLYITKTEKLSTTDLIKYIKKEVE